MKNLFVLLAFSLCLQLKAASTALEASADSTAPRATRYVNFEDIKQLGHEEQITALTGATHLVILADAFYQDTFDECLVSIALLLRTPALSDLNCVIDFDELPATPNLFGSPRSSSGKILQAARHVTITGLSITKFDHFFFCNSHALQTIAFSSFIGRIDTVGYGFLSGCSNIKIVDFSPLAGVTEIDDSFCFGCNSIRAADLRPFAGAIKIGDNFFRDCKSLRTADLSPLAGASIGDSCLAGSGVQHVNLGACKVGNNFLKGCNLKTITAAPYTKVAL